MLSIYAPHPFSTTRCASLFAFARENGYSPTGLEKREKKVGPLLEQAGVSQDEAVRILVLQYARGPRCLDYEESKVAVAVRERVPLAILSRNSNAGKGSHRGGAPAPVRVG